MDFNEIVYIYICIYMCITNVYIPITQAEAISLKVGRGFLWVGWCGSAWIPTAMGYPFSAREARLDARLDLRCFWVGRDGSAWIPKAMGYHSPAREARWRLFGTRSAPKRSTRFTFFSGWVASALRGSRRPWVILARRAKRAVFCSAREARLHFLCARSAPTRST
jgi:hypothetical protein